MACLDGVLLLLHLLHIQGVEIYGSKEQWREAALGDKIGNSLARIRKEDIRAIAAYQRTEFLLVKACHRENAGLADFHQIRGFFAQFYRDRCGQADLEQILLKPLGVAR